MIESKQGKFYIEVPVEAGHKEDVCLQCDYMQNEGFLVGTCTDSPCDPYSCTVLKEVDYAYL